MNKKMYALGRLKTGEMNATETWYAGRLKTAEMLGAVLWWKFEGLKLRLADNTFYTPDFVAMAKDGVIECIEIKGFWMDDARAKIKIAASIYPFRFISHIVKKRPAKRGGGYEIDKTEEF
ncbi:MAG: DUF1064 domain-containing protein [Desulfobulbaceae bacterium]|nr:DUF1064 domain-containing protein [Desulfobulbaceae bacterium]